MAEERDPMTTADTGYAVGGGSASGDVASGAHADREKAPDVIERGIRETRAEMSETIDAISARFRPDYLKDQAKDALRNTARDAGTTMLDTIKANPIPSLIAGLSIGWLIAKGGQSNREREWGRGDDYYSRYGYGRYPDYGAPYGYGRYDTGYEGAYGDRSMREKAADAAGQAKEKAGDLAHEARERVGDLTHQAADQVQELGHDVQHYRREAANWLEHQMYASPLAVGAVALATGALVGLAVPGTQTEDELMGRASERLTEKVKDVAEEKAEQVKAVAQETAGEAKEKAREVMDTAKEEAEHQGLTSGGGDSRSRSGATGGSAGTAGGSTGGSFNRGTPGSDAGVTGTRSRSGTGTRGGNR